MDGMTQVLSTDMPPRAPSVTSLVAARASGTKRVGPRVSDDGMAVCAMELDVTELLEFAGSPRLDPDARDPAWLLGITHLVFTSLDGEPSDNKYGPNPKGFAPAHV